jgi:membrane protease YdiL (CAAX protease family)
MNKQTTLQKVLHFFLTKIVIGILVIGGSVAFVEWFGRLILNYTSLTDNSKNALIAITDVAVAICAYVFLFKSYEKRNIEELSTSSFLKNAIAGFTTGLMLQCLFVLVIYIAASYSILKINPAAFLIPSLTTAFIAGFVAEIIIRGIIFRLAEATLGTAIALLILFLLFALMHFNAPGATMLSILSTAMQAGILLSAAYVYTRNLWFTIFLHFAWDFAEPGIFGLINPGNTINQSLLKVEITGPDIITGGQSGPQNSIQGFIICSITAILFLWLAKKKKNFVRPYWKTNQPIKNNFSSTLV